MRWSLPGGDGEVAVAAVVGAERDVDVGGARFEPGGSHQVIMLSGRSRSASHRA